MIPFYVNTGLIPCPVNFRSLFFCTFVDGQNNWAAACSIKISVL